MSRFVAAAAALVLLVLTAFSAQSVGASAVSGAFADDDASVHEQSIEAIAAAGITTGCNPPANDRYCPNSPVTRGQMAAFLVRALGLTDLGSATFVDTADSIFRDDIRRLAAAGITKGCNPPANDRYCPSSPVTRGQMAAFLVRALGLTARGEVEFRDDDGSVFEADIERLATAGITKGCNPPANDQYCPGQAVTRAQMASFLVRALDDLSPVAVVMDLIDGVSCSKDATCEVVISDAGDRTLAVREGWYHVLPFLPGEEAAFGSPSTQFTLTIDGSTIPLVEARRSQSGTLVVREWTGTFVTPPSGSMTLVARWTWNGDLVRTVIVTFDV